MKDLKLKFKLKPVSKKKKESTVYKRISNKLILGVVYKDDSQYKVKLNGTNEVLLFTEQSYDCKNRTDIFTKRPVDDKGRIGHIIRTKDQAKFSIVDNNTYVPFANNWLVSGYIVSNGIKRLFEFNKIITINGYNYKQSDIE